MSSTGKSERAAATHVRLLLLMHCRDALRILCESVTRVMHVSDTAYTHRVCKRHKCYSVSIKRSVEAAAYGRDGPYERCIVVALGWERGALRHKQLLLQHGKLLSEKLLVTKHRI